MAKGEAISLTPLFKSKIFYFKFDFDEWPQTHNNDNNGEPILRPFNYNLFQIRGHYKDIFPEPEFDDEIQENESSKMFKIKYSINLLPVLGTHIELIKNQPELQNGDLSFIEDIANCDELDIFN